ncbi:hypothetical protein M419DRAFT_123028 [Trichoderma reesei RUT C-30]|uniref:Uncharacterized protein n=1 Tax=Hypocrea jecorina (strain ATCC 56765 / BCRC 32924 / NRRL 11460 / Rut C-30) TaxID=1344414 RepID=A0A024SAR1_HYPJR|nr:hypothetical protein M419DRAFT_123028 [Trichoderma reesei RUT C-30]
MRRRKCRLYPKFVYGWKSSEKGEASRLEYVARYECVTKLWLNQNQAADCCRLGSCRWPEIVYTSGLDDKVKFA